MAKGQKRGNREPRKPSSPEEGANLSRLAPREGTARCRRRSALVATA